MRSSFIIFLLSITSSFVSADTGCRINFDVYTQHAGTISGINNYSGTSLPYHGGSATSGCRVYLGGVTGTCYYNSNTAVSGTEYEITYADCPIDGYLFYFFLPLTCISIFRLRKNNLI